MLPSSRAEPPLAAEEIGRYGTEEVAGRQRPGSCQTISRVTARALLELLPGAGGQRGTLRTEISKWVSAAFTFGVSAHTRQHLQNIWTEVERIWQTHVPVTADSAVAARQCKAGFRGRATGRWVSIGRAWGRILGTLWGLTLVEKTPCASLSAPQVLISESLIME